MVPFIVTKQELATPVLDFNIIEHLMTQYPNLEVLSLILNSVFPGLNKAKSESFVNLIQDNSNKYDFVGEVKASKI